MDETCEVLILSCQGRLGNRTIQPRKIQNKKQNKTKKEKKKKKINIKNYDITFLKLVQKSGLQNQREFTKVLLQARLT